MFWMLFKNDDVFFKLNILVAAYGLLYYLYEINTRVSFVLELDSIDCIHFMISTRNFITFDLKLSDHFFLNVFGDKHLRGKDILEI